MTPPATAGRWRVITSLGIVQIFAWGSSYYLIAVLAEPIVQDMGWPLPWVIGAVSLGMLCAGLVSPRIGQLISTYGGRPVMAAGMCLLASGLAIIAAATALPVFWLGWAVMGVGMAAGLYDPAFATLGRLYGREARSAITALTLWGGFASTVCWPLSAWLLEAFGWRGVALSYAGIHMIICLPLIMLIVPTEARAFRSGSKPKRSFSVAGVERPLYLLLSAIMIVTGMAVTIVSVHLLTLLQARGVSLTEAVALGALIGPAQVSSRLLEMATKGRYHPVWTMLCATAFMTMGLGLLASGVTVLGVAVVLYGAGNGIFSIARGTVPLMLFGATRYAVIMGRLARPALIAQASAPLLGAAVISVLGADVALMLIFAMAVVTLALTTVLISRVSPMTAPEE